MLSSLQATLGTMEREAIRRDFPSGRGGDGDYFRAAQSSAMGTANIC
jgi:hypothetical protein